MRKYLGILSLSIMAFGLLVGATGCGNAVANPCRWEVGGKVALPAEATEASSKSERNLVVLDFYAEGEDKAAFSRDVEIEPGQEEIVVDELPGDVEYTVKGSLYSDDECEAVVTFDAEVEEISEDEEI